MDKFYSLKLLIKYAKNPFSLFLYYFGYKKEVTCKLKHNLPDFYLTENQKDYLGRNLVFYDLLLNKYKNPGMISEFNDFINQISKNQEFLSVKNVTFINDSKYNSVLWEYFIPNPFYLENIENRTVIDIGANIGDSTLFMAKNGAQVYAFEPIKETFDMAIKNIDLNPSLKSKIHLYNLAVAGENKKINLYLDEENNSPCANSFVNNGSVYQLDAVSIDKIIKDYDVKADILKMDCEGTEYEIVEKSDLSMFNEIYMEYHEFFVKKSPDLIISKLEEQGFNVEIFDNPIAEEGIGFIVAKK